MFQPNNFQHSDGSIELRSAGLTVGASASLSDAISSTSKFPARNEAQLFLQSVQAPMRFPLWLPGIIGPVTRGSIGLFADSPPIIWAGTVLSHPILVSDIQALEKGLYIPPIIIQASTGWALIISSVSMLMRFLKNILVG